MGMCVAGMCVGYECAGRTDGGPVALLPLGSHDGFLEPSAGFRQVVIRGELRRVLAVDANLVIVQVSANVKVARQNPKPETLDTKNSKP